MKQIFILGLLLLTGCSRPSSAEVKLASPAVPDGLLTDNKDYRAWKSFPVGTKVVVHSETKNAIDRTVSLETYRLAESNDEKIIVDRQNTTTRGNGERTENPSQPFEFPARFRLPSGMTAEDFAKPSLKAKLKANESIDVLGQTYDCRVYTWTDMTESGPLEVTLWLSDKIPGGRARQIMINSKLGITTTETIKEIVVPKAP